MTDQTGGYEAEAEKPTRHWHFVVRHKHPEWHGHCGDPLRRGWKPCGRTHWHGPFRHRHTEDGR